MSRDDEARGESQTSASGRPGLARRSYLRFTFTCAAFLTLGAACASLGDLSTGGPDGGDGDEETPGVGNDSGEADSRGADGANSASDGDGDSSAPGDSGGTGDGGNATDSGKDAKDSGGADVILPPPPCQCAAAPRNAWSAPFILYDGNLQDMPNCPANTTEVLRAYANLQVSPAQCSCTCSPPTVTCGGSATVATYSGGSCTTPVQTSVVTTTNPCEHVSNGNVDDVGVSLDASAKGSCTPSDAAPSLPPLTWTTGALGCAWSGTDAGGCDAGNVCAPAPELPFAAKVCILQAGASACPGAPYSVPHEYFLDANDSRGCSPCSCGSSQDVACSARMNFFWGAGGCFFARKSLASFPADCSALSVNNMEVTAQLSLTPTAGGSCPPSGGAPIGDAGPKDPVLVCCQP